MRGKRSGRINSAPEKRPQWKGVYLLNFRFPQFARINIPLPKSRNDPTSQTAEGCPPSILIAGAWSIVAEIFPSGDFHATVFKGKESSSVNTFPNRGVIAPAATVIVTRIMAIFVQFRFTVSPLRTRVADQARCFSGSFRVMWSNNYARYGEWCGFITI